MSWSGKDRQGWEGELQVDKRRGKDRRKGMGVEILMPERVERPWRS